MSVGSEIKQLSAKRPPNPQVAPAPSHSKEVRAGGYCLVPEMPLKANDETELFFFFFLHHHWEACFFWGPHNKLAFYRIPTPWTVH